MSRLWCWLFGHRDEQYDGQARCWRCGPLDDAVTPGLTAAQLRAKSKRYAAIALRLCCFSLVCSAVGITLSVIALTR